ncbi:MAG: T9SS type A sorting domain-containing protein [Prevotella sp.]|jgi:hypothetical protein|nr:T9SS type A sorting domain-containing protein [Prevotella sp.]
MKKISTIIACMLLASNLFAAINWDILDKTMDSWNADGGSATNLAWTVSQGSSASGVATQQVGYVNFTKTNTGSSARWAWVRPTTAPVGLTDGIAYSIEVKARVREIDKTTYPDNASYYEANQIALRLSGLNAPIFLKYGDGVTGGYVSTTSGGTANVYAVNTSEWQIYRIVLRADHSKYDVYIDGVEDPLFENTVESKSDVFGVCFGAESQHRCNIDVEYVKMGTGDFFSKPKISSIALSQISHISGNESTVSVTVNTTAMDNGEELQFSLVDNSEQTVVSPVDGVVTNNVATANIVIPASVAEGVYVVKVAAKGQINGMDVTPLTALYEINNPAMAQWDILYRNFAVRAWNAYPSWALVKAASVSSGFVTQQTGYVNINKLQAAGSDSYGFLTSPSPTITIPSNTAYTYEIKARVHAIDKDDYPDVPKPGQGIAGGYESNFIALLMNDKYMSINLTYGGENAGYIDSQTTRQILNTSEWHVYRLVFNADNTKYDIYVDGTLFFEDVPLVNKAENVNVKIGGESWQRCNMDIEYIGIGTGDLASGNMPKITSAALSSDSHIANNERTVQVTVKTSLINDGEILRASLVNESGTSVATADIVVNSNEGAVNLVIPSTVPLGKYTITVAAPSGEINGQTLRPKSMQYVVVDVSPIDTKMLPQVKTVGYVTDMADYIYIAPSGEFIFPSIVDTKKSVIDGKFQNGETPIDRYYLYYAPHENPGGIFLSTAPTLDGPWTQYAGSTGMTVGTVIDYAWAATQSDIVKNGAEKHISACQVVWNEVQGKYIMYFHGPNTTTHYATSDNLVDWTFGASILLSHQFSPIGEEASYAKAFKHEIPGLDNQYVLLLMNQESQIRRIYWAHSKDGINWTPVPKALVSPDLNYKKVPGTDRKPNFDGGRGGAYGNNVSGPFLMVINGRYFVICHDSADNLHVVEVGESFDMEVHWGEYMNKNDVILNNTPTRPAAVDFIQDDNGKWYMFFEAGERLGANIAYAKEEGTNGISSSVLPVSKGISIYPTTVKGGEKLTVSAENADELSVEIIDVSGSRLFTTKIKGASGSVQTPIAPGLYFVKVIANENLVKTSKVIVR